jgi:hypothetical protein
VLSAIRDFVMAGQRIYDQFYLKLWKTASETHEMLKTAFGTSGLLNGFLCSGVGTFRLKSVTLRVVSPQVILTKVVNKTDEVPFRRLLAG